jgi:nucleoside-diphosphate-sugar epimerase
VHNVKGGVLVTGASGLVGGGICRVLHGFGVDIVGQFNASAKPEGFPSFQCDLTQKAFETISSLKLDAIVHAAASLPHSSSMSDAAAVNRVIDQSVCEYAKLLGLKVIFISGTSLYQRAGTNWISEESPLDASLNEYFEQKAESEQNFVSELGENALILRIPSPYDKSMKSQTVLKIFIERAMAGTDLVHDGEGRRMQDFIHVKDVGRAVDACLQRQVSGVFNIATATPVSMRELAELVVGLVPGTASTVRSSGLPEQQIGYSAHFEIGRANRLLGWRPQIALANGVREWIVGATE